MPCKTKVTKKLECGHIRKYECKDKDDENITNECQNRCEKMLKCGHNCQRFCKIDCEVIYSGELKKDYISSCK